MLELLVIMGLIEFYLVGAFAAGMLVQGIVYWTTKFSIYNYVIRKLFVEVQ